MLKPLLQQHQDLTRVMQSFLHIISLRTATELITLTFLVNKVTGLYGILAIFTGYELNWLQLSHYIYSLIILGVVTWLMPSIRKPQEPLKNVALAWIYVFDTVINSVYTILFGAGWFLVLAHNVNKPISFENDAPKGPGAETIDDTAGFTDPEYNATRVSVVVEPGPGLLDGQTAIAYGSQQGSLGSAIFQSGSIASFDCARLPVDHKNVFLHPHYVIRAQCTPSIRRININHLQPTRRFHTCREPVSTWS